MVTGAAVRAGCPRSPRRPLDEAAKTPALRTTTLGSMGRADWPSGHKLLSVSGWYFGCSYMLRMAFSQPGSRERHRAPKRSFAIEETRLVGFRFTAGPLGIDPGDAHRLKALE